MIVNFDIFHIITVSNPDLDLCNNIAGNRPDFNIFLLTVQEGSNEPFLPEKRALVLMTLIPRSPKSPEIRRIFGSQSFTRDINTTVSMWAVRGNRSTAVASAAA